MFFFRIEIMFLIVDFTLLELELIGIFFVSFTSTFVGSNVFFKYFLPVKNYFTATFFFHVVLLSMLKFYSKKISIF